MTKTTAFAVVLALLAATAAIAQPYQRYAQSRQRYGQPRQPYAQPYAQPRTQYEPSGFSSGYGPPTGGIEDQ